MQQKRLSEGHWSSTTPPAKLSRISWVSYPKANEWVYALAVWRGSHSKVSGTSRTLFAGIINAPTGIIKTNDTTSRLLSLAVVMVRVGAMRQRIEIARQRVSRYASLLETARIELQALQQEAVRQSRQQQLQHVPAPPPPPPPPPACSAAAAAATVCVECGKFYRELRRPQGKWHQCWRCAAHRCDKCGHIECGCLQDMGSPASP